MIPRPNPASPPRPKPGGSRDPRAGARLRAVALAALVALAAVAGSTAPTRADFAGFRVLRDGEPRMLLDDGDAGSLRAAIRQSLAWLERQPSSRRFAFGDRRLSAAEHAAGLRRFLRLLADGPPPEVLEARVLAEFDVLGADEGAGSALVTGYHEVVIEVSDRPSPAFPVPVLGVREHHAGGRWRDRSYPTRGEIAAGRLGARTYPLAWAQDPVDVFFMEIEGSGTLRFPDGREIRVGPAVTNGRPYRSIGRLLIDEGHLTEETVSMQAIRAWLVANPDHRDRVLHHNESVVFFRQLDGPPLGNLGVPLTPGRSVAADPRFFPAAALAFVRAERPIRLPDGRVAWAPFSRFVLNQDTGGAIRGPGRVDVFWGRGPDAALAASEMKQPGQFHVLVPKPSAPGTPAKL